MALLALVFLSFLAGSGTSYFDTFPSTLFRPAFQAAEALLVQTRNFQTPYDSNLWQPVAHPQSGVVRSQPAALAPGFTLYTAGNRQGALLIDQHGTIVHEWSADFYAVFPDAAHLDVRPDPEFIAWRKALLWPNGDIVAVFIAEGVTPWGLGVVKLDKDSNVIWRYTGKAHHDIARGDDGTLYLLTHDIRSTPLAGLPRVKPPYLDDRIVALNPAGEPVLDIGILDAFRDSPYEAFLTTLPRSSIGDYLHANAIDVVTAELAAAHPYAAAGDILVSLRNPEVLALVSPATGKVKWATRGPWIGQHDPDMLANGNLLLFDNRGRMAAGGGSRVIEFAPLSGEIVWEYHGSATEPFYSAIRSAQQRLANGNTLITESDRARLLEVSPAGEIVWEYVNPDRGGPDNGYNPVLTWGQRYTAAELGFLRAPNTGE